MANKDVEELFAALRTLYYDSDMMEDGESSKAHHIVMYYQDYGYLDGCGLVRKSDEKALDKWYAKDKIEHSKGFDWSELPFNGSGAMPKYDDYRHGGSGW